MNEPSSSLPQKGGYFKNWLSLAGFIVAGGGLFAFILLLAIDAFSRDGNPYLGILTYIVAPAFLIAGLFVAALGWLLQRRHALRGGELRPLTIDFSRAKDRRILLLFGSGTVVFLMLTAFGSYQTYHFTESVEFCGKTCHTVMEPEFVTYHRSAHARVACTECHIGSGASWYVKSKVSGAYQIYSVLFEKYSRPIPTPVHNLRPAQDTCERCHWPEKFTGNLDRSYEHFISNRANTPFTVRMLLHVGGGKAGHGQFGGIHWHMNVANKVEYFSPDPQRQEIPWVRVTSRDGAVRVFKTEEFKGEPAPESIRAMDCIDCHNRPAHVSQTANDGIEELMASGRIDLSLANFKGLAVKALTAEYDSKEAAHAGIESFLRGKYAKAAGLDAAILATQEVYDKNFFPLMKADWRAYPNNLGHKNWPGCFRCHDDKHISVGLAAPQVIKGSDCNSCHTILAQGKGEELLQLAPKGLEFKHPGGDLDMETLCSDCHTGGNM